MTSQKTTSSFKTKLPEGRGRRRETSPIIAADGRAARPSGSPRQKTCIRVATQLHGDSSSDAVSADRRRARGCPARRGRGGPAHPRSRSGGRRARSRREGGQPPRRPRARARAGRARYRCTSLSGRSGDAADQHVGDRRKTAPRVEAQRALVAVHDREREAIDATVGELALDGVHQRLSHPAPARLREDRQPPAWRARGDELAHGWARTARRTTSRTCVRWARRNAGSLTSRPRLGRRVAWWASGKKLTASRAISTWSGSKRRRPR